MAMRKPSISPAAQPLPHGVPENDLSAEEYAHTRQLIIENIRSMDRNEVYTLGAVALTMAFSLSASRADIAIGSAVIPLALTYVARLRYLGIGIMIRTLNDFTRRKEQLNSSISWTTFQREVGAGRELRRNRFLFWRALLIGSAAFLVFQVASVGYAALTAKAVKASTSPLRH